MTATPTAGAAIAPAPGPLRTRLIAGLGLSQIVSWGTLVYSFPLLAEPTMRAARAPRTEAGTAPEPTTAVHARSATDAKPFNGSRYPKRTVTRRGGGHSRSNAVTRRHLSVPQTRRPGGLPARHPSSVPLPLPRPRD